MRPAHRHGAIPLSRVAVGFALSVWMLSGGVARGQAFRTTGEGLNVGHFLLYPSVDFEYTDSDNVFYSSQDLPEDQIIKSGMTVVRPRILMDLPIGGNRIRWVYSPLYRDYTSKSFVQTQRFSHYFDFEALHTGPVVTVRGGYHLVLGTEELREVDRGGELVFGTTPFKAYVTEAEVTLSMGARNGISVLPRYNAVAFDDSTPNPNAEPWFDAEYRKIRNRNNHYLIDRDKQRTENFTGLGPNFVIHDSMATESMGSIFDRSREHLGLSDKAVISMRRYYLDLLQAFQRGEEPPGLVFEEAENVQTHVDTFAETIEGRDWRGTYPHLVRTRGEARELTAPRTLVEIGTPL